MTHTPTGVLSFVATYMDEARERERRATSLSETEAYHSAITMALEAKMLKEKAGIEFLLWALAALAMPAEPNPWQEHLAKEKAEREKKEQAKKEMN